MPADSLAIENQIIHEARIAQLQTELDAARQNIRDISASRDTLLAQMFPATMHGLRILIEGAIHNISTGATVQIQHSDGDSPDVGPSITIDIDDILVRSGILHPATQSWLVTFDLDGSWTTRVDAVNEDDAYEQAHEVWEQRHEGMFDDGLSVELGDGIEAYVD